MKDEEIEREVVDGTVRRNLYNRNWKSYKEIG